MTTDTQKFKTVATFVDRNQAEICAAYLGDNGIPAGVFTAGQAQKLVNLGHYDIGSRIVILGSGDIGQIMARRFTLCGKTVVAMVELSDRLGGLARNRRECIEAYRIPVILGATVRLSEADPAAIHARMMELWAKRSASQPLDRPSAGSTFKRPTGGYAAAMIDGAGLRGLTVGGAQVSEKHAGFVINTGDATFADVTALMARIRAAVQEKYGVLLEPEVRIL